MQDQTSKSKRIAKNTLLLYFRMLFLMFINLYASRVILEALGVEDYGVYNVVGGFVAMFSIISSPLTSACSRFLNFEMGKGIQDRIRIVFSTSLSVHILLAVIIAILCEVIGVWYLKNHMVLPAGRLVAATFCFHFSVFNFCTNLITIPYNAAIIAHERMKVFAYVSLFEGIAKLLVCFIIMVTPFDRLVFYGFLLLIIQLSVRATYQLYCKRNFEECRYTFVIDRVLIGQMFAYTSWQFLGHTSRVLKTQGVDLLLNSFFGPVLNAAKGVANQVQGTVEGFAYNFMVAMNPQITQSYAEGDFKYMIKLVFNGSRYAFYMLLILSLPIIINADFILSIWLKQVPDYTVVFVQLTLVCALITSLSNTLITAMNATGNIKYYQIAVGGILLMNLPLCYLFLYLGFNAIIVMIVAILTELFSLFVRLIMVSKNISLFNITDYSKNVIFPCFTIAVLAAVLPFCLKYILDYTVFSSLANITLSFLIGSLAIFFLGCSSKERKLVISKVIKILHRS